jgi:anti-anti-sigma factor
MSGLEVSAVWDEDRCLLCLQGEARVETLADLKRVEREIEERGARAVLVDMARVTFMDSASTGSMLRLHQRTHDRGGRLVMYALPRLIERLFDRLGLGDTFLVAADESAARALLP